MERRSNMTWWRLGVCASALALVVTLLSACTETELRDSLYAGGKVVYDSFKGIGENARRDRH